MTGEMKTYVAAAVAEGILHRGGTARTEADRLALVEDLARDAIDQVASQMIQAGLACTDRRSWKPACSATWWPPSSGSVDSSCSWTTTASRTSISTGATTCG